MTTPGGFHTRDGAFGLFPGDAAAAGAGSVRTFPAKGSGAAQTWTCDESGLWRFFALGPGGAGYDDSGGSGNTYGGASGGLAIADVRLSKGDTVALSIPLGSTSGGVATSPCTVTFPNGRVLSGGGGSVSIGGVPTGGAATGGDVNIAGTAGSINAAGLNASGADGGAGGVTNGGFAGGSGAPGYYGVRGGDGATLNTYAAGPGGGGAAAPGGIGYDYRSAQGGPAQVVAIRIG